MKRSLSGALVAVSLGLSLGQAVTFTPVLARSALANHDGVRGDHRSRPEISRREAIHMAKFSGVTRVRNVDRRGRYWIVLGETHRGRRLMNVRIDARSGRVVGMDRVR
jgi:multidrug efflux pump subunit AcrB